MELIPHQNASYFATTMLKHFDETKTYVLLDIYDFYQSKTPIIVRCFALFLIIKKRTYPLTH